MKAFSILFAFLPFDGLEKGEKIKFSPKTPKTHIHILNALFKKAAISFNYTLLTSFSGLVTSF
jgi:hypothetical protein